MCRSTSRRSRRNEAGFTLIEVLVALAVVAVSIVAIGSLIAANIRTTVALDQRLTLVETTRAILTGLPDGNQLSFGRLSGEVADHSWRVDVLPFQSNFVDPGKATPWIPQTVVVRVQSPTGQILRIDTVRLRHR